VNLTTKMLLVGLCVGSLAALVGTSWPHALAKGTKTCPREGAQAPAQSFWCEKDKYCYQCNGETGAWTNLRFKCSSDADCESK
jgi:hypothetical protein